MITHRYTVEIHSDCRSLGEDATQEDLDGYAKNLAAKLATDFGVRVEVIQTLGGRGGARCSCDDEGHEETEQAIAQAVRDIQGSDDWTDLLPEAR
jgi:hypothetical protein